MCYPWSGEQEVHSDMSKGDSVTLSITLLARRLQEVNKKFSQLSTSEARSLFEEEVCDYLADSVPSCNCDRILVLVCAIGQVAAIRRRDQEEIAAAAQARGIHNDQCCCVCENDEPPSHHPQSHTPPPPLPVWWIVSGQGRNSRCLLRQSPSTQLGLSGGGRLLLGL